MFMHVGEQMGPYVALWAYSVYVSLWVQTSGFTQTHPTAGGRQLSPGSSVQEWPHPHSMEENTRVVSQTVTQGRVVLQGRKAAPSYVFSPSHISPSCFA